MTEPNTTRSKIAKKFRTAASDPKRIPQILHDKSRFARQRLMERVHSPYKKTSYSQSGEDLILHHLFTSIGVKHPSYIDIGAHHPEYLSNTALFNNNGSRGVNIEPDPDLFMAFTKRRPRDINLNIGVADEAGELTFYKMNYPALNTFSDSEVAKYKERGYKVMETDKVKVDTVNNIIRQHCDGIFPDLLTLDVEGLDMSILRSINYKQSSPLVICVESVTPHQRTYAKVPEVIDFLKAQGYMVYADTFINTIFLKPERWENLY